MIYTFPASFVPLVVIDMPFNVCIINTTIIMYVNVCIVHTEVTYMCMSLSVISIHLSIYLSIPDISGYTHVSEGIYGCMYACMIPGMILS